MHIFASANQRDRHDRRADSERPVRLWSVVNNLTAELVTHDNPLGRTHEPVIASFGEHVGLGIGVVSGVQVRAADATARHFYNDLVLARFRCGQIDDVKLRVLADDCLHAGNRLSSNGGSGLMNGSRSLPDCSAVNTSVGSSLM